MPGVLAITSSHDFAGLLMDRGAAEYLMTSAPAFQRTAWIDWESRPLENGPAQCCLLPTLRTPRRIGQPEVCHTLS